MRKFYALLLFLFLGIGLTHALDYTSIKDGDWHTASTWDNGVPPEYAGAGNSIVINHHVTSVSDVLMEGETLIVGVDGTYELDGYCEIFDGAFTVNGKMIYTENGDFYFEITPLINGVFEWPQNGGTLPAGLSWGGSSVLEYSGITNTWPTLQSDSYNDLLINSSVLTTNMEISSGSVDKFSNILINNTGAYSVLTDAGDLTTISGDLSIGSNGKLCIGPTDRLTVDGSITNTNNANFLLQSSNLGTGSLICNNSAPNATVQRYVSKGNWHLMGPPVTGANANPTFLTGYMQVYDEPTNTWAAMEEDSYPLTRGEGDAFYFIPSDFTATYTGALLGAPLTMSGLDNTTDDGLTGYHCLANPFPSAITWALCTRTNVGAAQIYNGSSYEPAPVIPAQQGFFTQVDDGTTGSVTFTTAAKTHDAATFYKNGSPWGESIILKLTDNYETSNDQLIVRLHDNATFEYDTEYDARKIEGNPIAGELFAHISNTDYASMIGIPFNEETLTIPVGFKKGDELEYTLELAENNFSDNIGITLEDIETGQYINLKTQPTYVFTSTASNNNRFNLMLSYATGVDENLEETDINIWMASDKVYVQSFENQSYSIFVYSVSGKLVKTISSLNDELTSFILNEPKGAYIIKYISENKTFSQKIIK